MHQHHDQHLNATQAEQARNLVDLINERLKLSPICDRSILLSARARESIAELQREIGR